MPGTGEISTCHNCIASDVRKILGVPVDIRSPLGKNWYGVQPGVEIEFELFPDNLVNAEIVERKRREGGRVHRVSVFQLAAENDRDAAMFWVSWHESWAKADKSTYNLNSSGWTLFQGAKGSQEKTQILRADWDQLQHQRSRPAGHPHWHFDHAIFSMPEEKHEIGTDLVEITEESFQTDEKAVGFIHLAMGAWNGKKDHPECWQRTYMDDCQQLRDWCIKTLKYLMDQVGQNRSRRGGRPRRV